MQLTSVKLTFTERREQRDWTDLMRQNSLLLKKTTQLYPRNWTLNIIRGFHFLDISNAELLLFLTVCTYILSLHFC